MFFLLTSSSTMSDPGLVTALTAIIKGAVEPAAAEPILAAAPTPALAQAARKTNAAGEIQNILTSILSQGNQSNNNVAVALRQLPGPPATVNSGAARPQNAIGNAYYAGQRRGYVFGSRNAPKFRRAGQNTNNSSYKGWILRPVESPLRNGNVPRFEFVQKNYSGFGGGNFKEAISQNAPPEVAAGLLAIITGAVKPQEAARLINSTSQAQMPKRVANIGRELTNVVVGAVGARQAIGGLPSAQRQQFMALPPPQQQAVLTQPMKFPTFTFPSWFRRGGAPPAAAAAATQPTKAPFGRFMNIMRRPANQGRRQAQAQGPEKPSLLNRVMGRKPKSVNQRQAQTQAKKQAQKQAQTLRPGTPSLSNRVLGRKPMPASQRQANQGQTSQRQANQGPGKPSFWNRFKGLWPPAKKVAETTADIESAGSTKARLEKLENELKNLKSSVTNARRLTLVKQIITHHYPPSVLNGTKPLPQGTAATVEKELQQALGPGNYSNKNIKNMFAKRGQKNGPSNLALSEKLDREIAALGGMTNTQRARRMGELLRMVPTGFKGRAKLTTVVLEEIRRIGRNSSPNMAKRRLADLKSDLKLGYDNKNLLAALTVENKRAANNIRQNEGVGRRRGESEPEYRRRLTNTKRRSYETNYTYDRRIKHSPREYGESNYNYERRLETYSRRRNETNSNYGMRVAAHNRRRQMEREEIMRRRRLRGGTGTTPSPPFPIANGMNNGMPPLPTNQNNAIQRAGGVNAAMNAVAAVPGGAPEIAKAAEILNETAGNVAQAVNIKGASPVAVQAVRRLGGPTNAVNALEGLNTLSQTRATRKRKAATRKRGPGRSAKPTGPRVAELQRVIKSVKKRKLISLVAHNITKTNNIHENENRLKKYYQKVVKAAILRTPLANIVKKSKANVRAKK